MNRQERRIGYSAFVLGFFLIAPVLGQRHEAHTEIGGSASAKGITVLRLSFPTQGDVRNVSLFYGIDEDTYVNASAGPPRSLVPYSSIRYEVDTTTVLVPIVGHFPWGTYAFLFAEPRTYCVRWGIGFKDPESEGFKVYQDVEVLPPRPVDLEFIERVGDPDFLRHLFGNDFFDRKTEAMRERLLSPASADYRALIIITELLEATRAKELVDAARSRGSVENALKWADALCALARELPESSYAPYAAYYAGCCYMRALQLATKGQSEETILASAKNSPYYHKAQGGIALAVKRGDAYLNPRALCQQGFLRLLGGSFDEAEELMEKALEAGGERGTIQKIVDELRRSMAHMKERRSQAQKDQHD